ncbi:hypothetical protein ACF3OE_03615 [Capnocytophaga canis]|uniref:hypothetical protein n=1 Tax=Capnocytophaga canis TaxID=1848903 RepID=UPI00370D62E6
MKYFNENNFKGWKKDDNYTQSEEVKYLKKDNKWMEVRTYENDLSIGLKLDINEPYEEIYVYSPKTKICTAYQKMFYDVSLKMIKFDELGKLIEEKDYDADYKISVEELVKIGKEKLGIDLMDYSDQKNVNRYDGTGLVTKPIYVINILLRKGWGRTITVDATTGDILFDKEFGEGGTQKYKNEIYQIREENNPQSSAPYRTHNGKSYTEEEWKAFEEQEYQKYLEKKNKKGFWERLFGG